MDFRIADTFTYSLARLTGDLVTGKLDMREAAARLPAPPTAPAAEPTADALDGDNILDETEPEES